MGKSEQCRKCIHTNVCMKDKNLFGDIFIAGNPMIFDNEKLFQEFKKRQEEGFSCKDYLSSKEYDNI